ncbi:MAG: hypothetical protein FDZ69_10275 [Deltaproteobacteria bacterium]|nr:MAG: hypothetical protein FDZ69_10275 [Deltaproteobacteria bacterium]
MKIACPHCGFSRDVPDDRVPDRPVKVTCPKCQQGFSFDKNDTMVAGAFDATFGDRPAAAAPETAAQTVCPACGLAQPEGDACAGCGVIYARWAARHAARPEADGGSPPPPAGESFPGRAAYRAAPADLPKAGFWIRFVASMIDGLLLGAVQFVIGLMLGFAGGAAGDFEDGGASFALFAITWLCSMVVSVTYYVFFTGYNGQTPGKMAVRIQVVRTDGTPLTYWRAFVREIPAKFVSALILGVGYLMAAFDRDKQALHDRIAGTYVIRL